MNDCAQRVLCHIILVIIHFSVLKGFCPALCRDVKVNNISNMDKDNKDVRAKKLIGTCH